MQVSHTSKTLWTRAGFTLLELIVVIAIIAILSVLGLPAYDSYTGRAKLSEGLSMAQQAKLAVTEYALNHHQLPSGVDQEALGLPEPTAMQGQHVSSIAVEDGGIVHIVYKHDLGALNLVPVLANDQIQWRCQNNGIDAKYLPSTCREGT